MSHFVFAIFVLFIVLILVIIVQGLKYFKGDSGVEQHRQSLRGFAFVAVTVSVVSAIVFFVSGQVPHDRPLDNIVINQSRIYLEETFADYNKDSEIIIKENKMTSKELHTGYFLLSYSLKGNNGELKVSYRDYKKNKQLVFEII